VERVLLHAAPTAERPMILTYECHALGERAISSYFTGLRFDAAGLSGAQTHDLPIAKLEHYHYVTIKGTCSYIYVNYCTAIIHVTT
jgi:hypothetical protein